MNILYLGGGFVGACSAAVSADSGHQTLVYDVDAQKVAKLSSGDRDTIESCLWEDGLGDLLIRNRERIIFTTDYASVEKWLDNCDAVFMCLPTPEIGETGESDLSFYYKAAEQLCGALKQRQASAQTRHVVVVNKSTVPINMVDVTERLLTERGVKNFGVVANPEFLVEGKAIEGSIHPDRVVVGARGERDFALMRKLYERFYTSASVKYLEVSPEEAAAGKLLANFYLFNRLAVCFDVIGRTAETFPNLKFENLRTILTSDPRIGRWGFYDSLYAGGSCFIKDARSLSFQLESQGQPAALVNETYLANQRQLEIFLGRAERDLGFDWANRTVAILGLAFKQDTNDTRNSPSANIVEYLLARRVRALQLYDPAARGYFASQFPASEVIKYAGSEAEAVQGAKAIIIATDWPQFRAVADQLIAGTERPLIMDGRRLWAERYPDLQQAGFDIVAVGSQFIKGNK